MEYIKGQFNRKCASCKGETFNLLGSGKSKCAVCANEFKGFPGLSGEEVDELYVAVTERVRFLRELLHGEKDNLSRRALTTRCGRAETLLSKLKEAARQP